MPGTANLIAAAIQLRRDGDCAASKHAATEVVKTARSGKHQLDLGKALRELAETERKLHNSTAACQHYEEASNILRRTGPPLLFAHTIRHLGDLYTHNRNLAQAEHCCLKALEIYRQQNNTHSLDYANALRSLAALKTQTGPSAAARDLWQQVRNLYIALDIPEGEAGSTAELDRIAKTDT